MRTRAPSSRGNWASHPVQTHGSVSREIAARHFGQTARSSSDTLSLAVRDHLAVDADKLGADTSPVVLLGVLASAAAQSLPKRGIVEQSNELIAKIRSVRPRHDRRARRRSVRSDFYVRRQHDGETSGHRLSRGDGEAVGVRRKRQYISRTQGFETFFAMQHSDKPNT